MPHRGLSIFLALALLLFSWAQSGHASDLTAHQGDDSCAYCLFTGPLDHGTTPGDQPLPLQPAHATLLQPQTVCVLPQSPRHILGQRGPPTFS